LHKLVENTFLLNCVTLGPPSIGIFSIPANGYYSLFAELT
uniref:LINE-like reverse transcriptase n=1 Tax=Haemonchus placei TaxID=6290 RepID=A0A0N4WTV8_HAEPC